MKEVPLTPSLVQRLVSLRGRYKSRMKYEWVVRRVWSGVPDVYLDPILEKDIEDKIVYEFDPIKNQVDSTPIDFNNDRLFKLTKDLKSVASKGYNFMFYGANGSGKTFSALYLLSEAISQDLDCYYIFIKDLYNLYNEVSYKTPTEVEVELYDYIMTADYLVLDEVGKETLSAPLLSFLETLLKSRAMTGKVTVICTNIDVRNNNFLERYGNSIWDLIRGSYFVFHFSSKGDFRQKHRIKWEL